MTDITKEVIEDAVTCGFYIYHGDEDRGIRDEICWERYNTDKNIHDSLIKLATLQRQREVSAVLDNNWKDKLATIVDMYFDGIENEPYERTYVVGSFCEQMHELREMFRLEESLSTAPTKQKEGE